jgi:hypothetical protein
MDDAVVVGVLKGVGDLADDAERVRDWKRPSRAMRWRSDSPSTKGMT